MLLNLFSEIHRIVFCLPFFFFFYYWSRDFPACYLKVMSLFNWLKKQKKYKQPFPPSYSMQIIPSISGVLGSVVMESLPLIAVSLYVYMRAHSCPFSGWLWGRKWAEKFSAAIDLQHCCSCINSSPPVDISKVLCQYRTNSCCVCIS